jgi:hypothetical protein
MLSLDGVVKVGRGLFLFFRRNFQEGLFAEKKEW